MDRHEKAQPDTLLEEIWFFGNLLDKRTKTTKTMSRTSLRRAPSLPPCVRRDEDAESEFSLSRLIRQASLGSSDELTPNHISKEVEQSSRVVVLPEESEVEAFGDMRNESIQVQSNGSAGKGSQRKPRTSLRRAPSLPPCVRRDEDAESEFSLSRLIRQASLSSSDELIPNHISKEVEQSSSAPKYRPQTKPLPEESEIEAFHDMRNQSIQVQSNGNAGKSGQRKPRTSLRRAPSLPPCVRRDEDAESEFSLSRLIRQASLSSSDELTPNHIPKEVEQSSSARRYRPQTKPLPEESEIEAFHDMRNQSIQVQSNGNAGKSGQRKPRTSLRRAPSLPPCVRRDEDAESEFSLSRLIRQASLSSSDESTPNHISKEVEQSSSAPRYPPQTKPLPEESEIEAFRDTRNQSVRAQSRLRRTMSDAKLLQVEGHKDTCYKSDQKFEIPCFQEKPRMGYRESLSAEDMKAQIKYWARNVAANMR